MLVKESDMQHSESAHLSICRRPFLEKQVNWNPKNVSRKWSQGV